MNYYFNDRVYFPFISEAFGLDASKIAFISRGTCGDLGYSMTEIDEEREKLFNRPRGRYVSFEPCIDFFNETEARQKLVNALSEAIVLLNDGTLENGLVLGLGNSRITADSLGMASADNLKIKNDLKYLLPEVGSVTGVESFDIAQSVCQRLQPSTVIVVDTLSTERIERLGRSFQLTDSGISAGSGVGNGSKLLCRNTLGAKVIAIGVPLVMYAKKICPSASVPSESVLTPSNIDFLVNELGNIIGSAINKAAQIK